MLNRLGFPYESGFEGTGFFGTGLQIQISIFYRYFSIRIPMWACKRAIRKKKRKRESDSTVIKTDRPKNRVLSPRITPSDQMQVASGPLTSTGEKSGDDVGVRARLLV